jgi:agmatinase
MEVFDEELWQDTSSLGIHTLPFVEPVSSGPEEMIKALSEHVYKIISKMSKDKILICLGGEHSISPGPVRAFKRKYPKLSVLHFDAHADLRDSYQGTPYSHACAARRMLESCPVVSCGIRSISPDEAVFAKKSSQNIFWYKSAFENIDKVLSLLTDDVYISLDVDVLDPSVMPSTGTPEPDGWTWRELCNFLRAVTEKKNVVGLDIVELEPKQENRGPDFSVAKLLYRLMGHIAVSKKWM